MPGDGAMVAVAHFCSELLAAIGHDDQDLLAHQAAAVGRACERSSEFADLSADPTGGCP